MKGHAEFKRAVADILERRADDVKRRTAFVRADRAAIAEVFRVCRNALGRLHRVTVTEVVQVPTSVQTQRLNVTYRGVEVVVQITTVDADTWSGYQ